MTLTLRNKVAVLGDATVGKSALVQVLKGSGYPKNYVMTVGAELSVKLLQIPETEISVELLLIDVAGNNLFKHLVPKYLDGCSVVALVYDITNAESFASTEKWLDLYKRISLNRATIGVLIAAKADLEDRAVIKSQQGQQLAEHHGLEFFECSALRSPEEVEAPFNWIAKTLHGYYESLVRVYDSIHP